MQVQKIKKRSGKTAFRVICFLITLMMLFSAVSLESFAANGGSEASKYAGVKLCPGGMAFGVKFMTKGLMVVGITGVKSGEKELNPSSQSGIEVGDLVLSVNGKETEDVKSFSEIVEKSNGKAISLTVLRGDKNKEISLTPVKCDSDGKYKVGLWLKDSTAGIGTVTFIDPESGEFGGLGHGICDRDTGTLLPIKRGTAMKVEIGGVVKGKIGKPGEIKGYFLPEKTGSVFSNTVCGVFGAFTETPSELNEAIPLGTRDEVKEGNAEIISTLGSDGPQIYSIEISKISRQDRENKSFVIKVTDKKLIERTGGIVQGMSGSPIIQDGKLIGAVTHV